MKGLYLRDDAMTRKPIFSFTIGLFTDDALALSHHISPACELRVEAGAAAQAKSAAMALITREAGKSCRKNVYNLFTINAIPRRQVFGGIYRCSHAAVSRLGACRLPPALPPARPGSSGRSACPVVTRIHGDVIGNCQLSGVFCRISSGGRRAERRARDATFNDEFYNDIEG